MEQEIVASFESLEAILIYLMSGVGGVALAHFLERMSWFKSMAAGGKFWFVLVLSIILAVVGVVGSAYLYGGATDLNTMFMALQSAVIVFAGSQYGYSTQIKANKVE